MQQMSSDEAKASSRNEFPFCLGGNSADSTAATPFLDPDAATNSNSHRFLAPMSPASRFFN